MERHQLKWLSKERWSIFQPNNLPEKLQTISLPGQSSSIPLLTHLPLNLRTCSAPQTHPGASCPRPLLFLFPLSTVYVLLRSVCLSPSFHSDLPSNASLSTKAFSDRLTTLGILMFLKAIITIHKSICALVLYLSLLCFLTGR